MSPKTFLAVRDKPGKTHFISTKYIARVVEIDRNAWQIEFASGRFTVVDSFEAQRLLKKLPGTAGEVE